MVSPRVPNHRSGFTCCTIGLQSKSERELAFGCYRLLLREEGTHESGWLAAYDQRLFSQLTERCPKVPIRILSPEYCDPVQAARAQTNRHPFGDFALHRVDQFGLGAVAGSRVTHSIEFYRTT